MASSGMLHRVALVRTDVSEEPLASFIRVTKIGELGTTQAATSNRRTLRRNTQKTSFFIVTAVKTSNLTSQKNVVHTLNTSLREYSFRIIGGELQANLQALFTHTAVCAK
jgi:hypothetical protein